MSTRYEIFRTYDGRPGCIDFLGVVVADEKDTAYTVARARYGVDDGEELLVEVEPAGERA